MRHSELRPSDQRFTSNIIAPLTFVADILCLVLSVPLALLVYQTLVGERIDPDVHVAAVVIAGVAFLLIRQAQGAYLRPFTQLQTIDAAVVIDYAIAALLSTAVLWQLRQLGEFSRGLSLIYVSLCGAVLLISRFLLHGWLIRLARQGKIGQRIVLYGADADLVERTCRIMRMESLPHLSIIGVANDGAPGVDLGLPYLGGLPEVVELARSGEVDQVYIIAPDLTRKRLDSIMGELSVVSIDVSVIPSDLVRIAPNYRVSFLGTTPVLTLWRRPIRDTDRLVKKAEDMLIAALALLVFAPVLLVTAVAIKVTSPGPILFRQPRFGFNNREILVYKFRSMYLDRQDVLGAVRTRKNDDRVTPVGRIIRKLSIDELPQLWNVFKGEMSIVGPRPHAVHMKVGDVYYLEAVRGYGARHRVKPGITGLAQVRGLRGEIQTIERAKRRVELDIFYIDNWSLGLDLRIIIETVVGVLFDKDAY